MDGHRPTPLALLAGLALSAVPAIAWAPAPPAGSAPPPLVAAATVKPVAQRPLRQLATAELRCLALNVYWEARGQPLAGQAAVAHVTLNRVASQQFAGSVCGVVYQGCQFGWTCDNRPKTPTDTAAWDEALAVARQAAAAGADPTDGALYFHHVQERPQWARGRYGHRVVIGQHVFFNTAKDQQVAEAR